MVSLLGTKKLHPKLILLHSDCAPIAIPGFNVVNSYWLIPKIPRDKKLVNCYLGSLCEKNKFFSFFFFWTSELHISQAYR